MAIVDPAPALLHRWHECTAVTGMRFLRSPAVHHIDVEPWSLQNFAGKRTRPAGLFTPPYDRPSLALFNAHSERVVVSYGLDRMHLRDRIVRIEVSDTGIHATTAEGETLAADHVVLAIGASEHPARPEWAPLGDPRVAHVFERDFDGWPTGRGERVAVIGGGISAGHLALRLAREGHRPLLVTRHPLREHDFDSDSGWLGPKYMTDFLRERDPAVRRAAITEARHRGSMPRDVFDAVQRALSTDAIELVRTSIVSMQADGSRRVLQRADGGDIIVDRILLATGFERRRPGGAMVDDLVSRANLPVAPCGYPVVDRRLRWHPRVFVSGPLAELELGPSSRNIAGARRAADRIIGLAPGASVASRPAA